MRPTHLCALAMAALAVTATPALAERIASEKEFVEKVGGKKLTARNRAVSRPEGWMIINADGRISGQTPALGIVTGSWRWKDRFYCRNIIVDAMALPHDCQTVSVKGNEVIFTRHQGNGLADIWTIE